MKLVLAWLAMLVLSIAASSSCTINHKSTEFACETQSDCADPRTCVNGFCVLPGGPQMDAPRDAPPTDGPRDAMIDAPPACPPQCTLCRQEKMECVIDCASTSCNAPIVCPTGWNCNVQCTTANSCRSGIDCTDALSCTVNCSGSGSCRNLESGTGKTTVTCTGFGSCRDMNCFDACACDIACGNNADCDGNICPSGCGTGFGRCSSTINPFCDDCP